MKRTLEEIKAWYETGDVPTQAQFHDTWDSFHHKDAGLLVKETTVNAEGNKVITLSDDTEIIIEQSSASYEGYVESGTSQTADLLVTIGDHTDGGAGTKIIVDDVNGAIKMFQKTLLINTEADGLSGFVKASIYQKETGGDRSSNEVNTFQDFDRVGAFASTSMYTTMVRRLLDTSDDDSTGGTQTNEFINRKTGAGSLGYQYATTTKNELHSGDVGFFIAQSVRNQILGTDTVNVSTVMRAISPQSLLDNPNATVSAIQSTHPNLTLNQGTVTSDAQVVFLDIDVETANLGTTLNVNSDVAYLQGGGGSDVEALKTYLEGKGKKLRFLWNQGTSESDFGGILNYTSDLSAKFTDRTLIDKGYVTDKFISYLGNTVAKPVTGDLHFQGSKVSVKDGKIELVKYATAGTPGSILTLNNEDVNNDGNASMVYEYTPDASVQSSKLNLVFPKPTGNIEVTMPSVSGMVALQSSFSGTIPAGHSVVVVNGIITGSVAP